MADPSTSKQHHATIVIDPQAGDGTLKTLPATTGLRTLTIQELHDSTVRFSPDNKVCVTTVAMIDEVLHRLDDESRRAAVETLRDKYAFRQLISAMYPDMAYRRIQLHALPQLVLAPEKTYVIKPVRGAFATGVRTISHTTDLPTLMVEIQSELQRNGTVFSDAALSQDDFLLETFIEGEEYAVDMFYNTAGQPVITSIYHHPMPRNGAYLHMLYYTRRAVFENLYRPAQDFFVMLNTYLKVRGLPIHAEFRFHNGHLTPIELNPLRFGGMGLGNLGFHAFGLNAYECFVEDKEPDWAKIWRDHSAMAYGFFIAYNGANIDVTTHRPDWPAFRQLFSRILLEVPFDYRRQLAFGILYIEEDPDALFRLLDIEFNDYFVPCDPAPATPALLNGQ